MGNTLPAKLREIASQDPDRVIIEQDKASGYTYKQFYDCSQAIAGNLINFGIKKGDCIAIVLENRPEWGMIYFGIVSSGAVAVPIDPQSSLEDLQYILEDSRARIVFTSSKLFTLFKGFSSLDKIITLDCQQSSAKVIPFSKLTKGSLPSGNESVGEKILPEDLASIIYTSGTTAKPKAVMLTQKNFYSNFESLSKLGIVSDRDKVLSILPLHHSYPFMVTLITPLFSRAKIIYTQSLKPDELLKSLRENQITILVGVPQLFYLFYKRITEQINKIPLVIRPFILFFIQILSGVRKYLKLNLSKLVLGNIHRKFGKSLRFLVSGGVKLDEPAARFLTKLGFTIVEGYGLTETSPVVTFNRLNNPKIGSVGKAIPDVSVKIFNPDGNGIGEVVVRGPNVMKGYFRAEEETRQVIKDGWFYTGDLGFLDREGLLYITGRKKETIVLSSGKNVSPLEVEAHYARSPFIKELCVLAADDQNQTLKAVVVPAFAYYREIGEINIYARINRDLENLSKQLPAYKRIMGFILTKEDLPRTRLGKLKRYQIRDRYSEELKNSQLKVSRRKVDSDKDTLEVLCSQLGKKIIEILTKELDLKEKIGLDDHLELDLGIDSLGRVELQVALENSLKITIPDSLIRGVFTVGEVIRELEELMAKLVPASSKTLGPKATSWAELLAKNPPEDIVKKINLNPSWLANLFIFLGYKGLYVMFKVFWRFKVLGRENVPKQGSFVVCANHSSYLDAFLVAAATPPYLRKKMYTLGLRVFFDFPLIRNTTRLIKVISIDPNTHLVESMQACAYILRAAKAICIFPEGGRSLDGEVGEFKKGIAILVEELNLSLIPVYISGSYESWPRTRRFPKFHPVKIIFGRPCDCGKLKKQGLSLGARDDYEAVALGIRQEVVKLKEKLEG